MLSKDGSRCRICGGRVADMDGMSRSELKAQESYEDSESCIQDRNSENPGGDEE